MKKNTILLKEKIEESLMDEMGDYFEQLGTRTMAGRILGLMIAQNKPISLKVISAKLRVSKPATIVSLYMLEQLLIIRKVYVPEYPRENFYEMSHDFYDFLFHTVMKKLDSFRDIMDTILLLPDKYSDAVDFSEKDTKKTIAKLRAWKRGMDIYKEEFEISAHKIRQRIDNEQ